MKKGLFFKLSLLFVFVLFLQDSFTQDSPQWHLPEGVKTRLGRGSIVEMRYSPDGTRLAIASSIGIWFYDTTILQEVNLFTGHTSWVTSIAYSPDGGTLASGAGWQDNTIRLWDVATGEQKGVLTGHAGGVSDVAFSPAGRILASSSYDYTSRLWDVITGEHVRTFTGHRDGVISIAFSPDGKTLATGSYDETTRLWDVATGKQKETLAGHTGWIGSIAFSPDGRMLATGSEDGTLLLWELPPPTVFGDVNRDGVVNLQDLTHANSNFGRIGQNDVDLNGDGVVNILDLVTVAGAIGEAAAAPSAHPVALGSLTEAEVRGWLTQVQGLDLMNLRLRRGIRFLEQLLAALIPKETGLLPNYPNPFNPETWIPYHLAHASDVTLTIYDATGAMVHQLDLGYQPVGFYTDRNRAAYWNGRNRTGELVASGIYFYQLRAGNYTATRRMVIVK